MVVSIGEIIVEKWRALYFTQYDDDWAKYDNAFMQVNKTLAALGDIGWDYGYLL